jgi:hypothetical protein
MSFEALAVVLSLVTAAAVWLLTYPRGSRPPVVPVKPKPIIKAVEVDEAASKVSKAVEALEAPIEVSDEDLEGLVDGTNDEPDLDVLRALQGTNDPPR